MTILAHKKDPLPLAELPAQAKKAGSRWIEFPLVTDSMPNICHTFTRRALPLLIVTALVACERKEPRVYLARKELPPATGDGHDHSNETPEEHAAHSAQPSLPKLAWTLPAGWKELGEDKMNVARFDAGGASVNVTPLASLQGKEPVLVNMWREAFQQKSLDEAEANAALSDIDIAGGKGKIFDLTGERGAEGQPKEKSRIVTAIFHRENLSWFFKLQGSPETVAAQLGAFKEFLGTVRFEAGPVAKPLDAATTPVAKPEGAPPTAAATPASMPKPPEGWVTETPGPMQMAKFTVPPKDGATAEVMVSVFPSDTGGAVANVRRWRGQIGMPEADDATIQAGIKPLEGGPEGATIVDLENAGRALIGAIVPRDGKYYFFKLMGGTPAVASARESFIVFVRGK